jgi:hypothetical protein
MFKLVDLCLRLQKQFPQEIELKKDITKESVVEIISSLIVYSSLPAKSNKVESNDPYAFEKSCCPEFNPNNEYCKIYLQNKSDYFKDKDQLKEQGLIQSGKWVAYHQGEVLVQEKHFAILSC